MPLTMETDHPAERTTHFISLGAGVQSTVLYLLACAGEIAPLPRAAIFADTRWEPTAVYEHLAWLEGLRLDVPIVRVSAGDLYANTWDALRLNRQDNNPFTEIPTFTKREGKDRMGLRPRQCTTDYKIKPILRKISELIGRPPKARTPYACQWLGITPDEWHRAKDARQSWLENRHPLLAMGMSRRDCLDYFQAQHPGRPLQKSSCIGCPYHSDLQWLELARADPDGMARTVALDERLREPERQALERKGLPQYLHSSGKPLRAVLADLDAKDRAQLPLFSTDGFCNECEGHCGL